MFSQASSNTKKREDFLEQAKQARENRATDHQRYIATIKIQAFVRGFLVRKRTWEQTREELESQISAWTFDCTQDNGSNGNDTPKLPPALQVFLTAKRFLKSYNDVRDRELFLTFCRYLVSTLSTDSVKASYVGVALNKEHALCWIAHIKVTLALCLTILVDLKPESPHDSRSLVLILHTLVSYTSINNWAILDGSKIPEALKPGFQNMCNNIMGHLVDSDMYTKLKVLLLKGLCRSRPSLKHSSLMAIVTLASRPLWAAEGSSKILSLFTMHIMSVPALVHHLKEITPEIMAQFVSHSLLDKTLGFLDADQNLRIVFHTLEGSLALCLLANIVHLTFLHAKELDPRLLHVVTRILEHCQHYVVSKKSNLSRWHPILGWFCQSSDLEHKTICDVHESMPFVKQQLQYLYAPPLSTRFWTCLEEFSSPVPEPPSDQERSFANLFKKRTGPKVVHEPIKYKKLGSNECTQVALVCNMYQVALTTLTQLRLDILTALSVQECFLKRLWNFLAYLGPCYGLKQYMDLLVRDTKALSPECKLLQMICETTNHLITVLDDIEMYEEQKPFSPLEYSRMALFLNNFMFKAISNSLIDANELTRNNLFTAAHILLMVLYRRDCRRRFTTDKNHWLIKDLRMSQFMADLERGKKSAQLLLQKMPHVFPLEERILLFRKYVHSERIVLGLTESACASPQSFLITVRRSRLVEDAFRQLVDLPPQSFKGIIRVKFINEQGLDEAGIDQDGVFKEFLEETIRKLFDPSLNLFRVTSDNRVYPSPTSHATESHLQLIEFAGRLLGKALYENLTINVPLAAFFLNQVAHHHNQNALYSAMDELPSLDPELYRSLTSVKNYPGDITDLSLTFAIDDEFLGQLTTHELRPGGKAIVVTNENKISYVHLMAHFRMHTQIKEQTAAFVRGFRALIQTDWLTLFSIPELQRLLGDDQSPIDLEDLRRNTQYYGGFHDSHRVICWLWDVLDNDFSDDERKLFLKFVTSCSQPPLLGFSHLQPPFSIRCVEVGDDEDHGDTIGSVIRGFFTIRKRDPVNRLPTSSTCFNLLKLPNYQKRSTLKEKLRYAITSNTGFELS